MVQNIRDILSSAFRYQRKPLKIDEIYKILENIYGNITKKDKNQIYQVLYYETRKDNGIFLKIENGYINRKIIEDNLRKLLRDNFNLYGININGEKDEINMDDKVFIRKYHEYARLEKLHVNLKFIEKYQEKLIPFFADGNEINPKEIWPKVIMVEPESENNLLFRYASLLWSVPVSQGFGRRTRFVVFDESNNKILGIFALGDPVYNLKCRDNWISWDHHQKSERLFNIMDIFVLGAIPPYNQLLGGKLVAMLASSNFVQNKIYKKYKNKPTIIQKIEKNPELAMLTTGSALGKSSLYDRIKFDDRLLYQKIGETQGWGHFHLNNGLFNSLNEYLKIIKKEKYHGSGFGQGPNWKIRIAKEAIRRLGYSPDTLQHGIKREIYCIPLAKNAKEYLLGQTNDLITYDLDYDKIASFWIDRWLIGRVKRKPNFINFQNNSIPNMILGEGSID